VDPNANKAEQYRILKRIAVGKADEVDLERLQELQDALEGWLAKGGFPPRGDVTMATALETMLDAYVTCALWSTMDESDESGGEPMDRNYSESDIHEGTMARMRGDCEAFLSANRDDIGDRFAEAGHDLWLTRNNHGAGFWDGDWPRDAGERLTQAAHKMGEVDLYVGDDGVIYAMGCES